MNSFTEEYFGKKNANIVWNHKCIMRIYLLNIFKVCNKVGAL